MRAMSRPAAPGPSRRAVFHAVLLRPIAFDTSDTGTELVPVSEVSNAIGLNSTAWNTARLLGPGAAGLLIALIGTGPVFVLNACTYVAQVVALISLDRKS